MGITYGNAPVASFLCGGGRMWSSFNNVFFHTKEKNIIFFYT
jgi:hypothetical protein